MAGKRKTEARRWFHQAYYDLKAAEWNFEGKFYNTVCFLGQQSAEKALKSLLYYSGARRKALLTHSLVEMVQEGGKKIIQVKDFMHGISKKKVLFILYADNLSSYEKANIK